MSRIGTIYQVVGCSFGHCYRSWFRCWNWVSPLNCPYSVTKPGLLLTQKLNLLLYRWLLAHLYPDNIERLITVSAPHPNLMWDHLHAKSQINNSWLKFIQCPYLPESDLSRTESIFLEKCLTHLGQEKRAPKNTSYTSKDSDDVVCNTLDPYKYVFNRKSDWTGPLNYYRNFPFYKIGDGKTVRCPCLIITGIHTFIIQLYIFMLL